MNTYIVGTKDRKQIVRKVPLWMNLGLCGKGITLDYLLTQEEWVLLTAFQVNLFFESYEIGSCE